MVIVKKIDNQCALLHVAWGALIERQRSSGWHNGPNESSWWAEVILRRCDPDAILKMKMNGEEMLEMVHEMSDRQERGINDWRKGGVQGSQGRRGLFRASDPTPTQAAASPTGYQCIALTKGKNPLPFQHARTEYGTSQFSCHLLWNQHSSESHFATGHLLHCLVGLVQWEFLNHDVNTVYLSK